MTSADQCKNLGCRWIFERQCNATYACSNPDVINQSVTCPYRGIINKE
ncbi:hypothetical protein MFMK1_003169 [Metallumcola ferriviriculae]|uniref:Uncharacterized protein n=1 Tax=Metallumcola ferriviriculae TaxID=3039180 RepID=A0AAU0USB8_9FIRM|nr:hypothetical protein MFMK1_003169 [Desulfitibacteraceae bacterium MK1]